MGFFDGGGLAGRALGTDYLNNEDIFGGSQNRSSNQSNSSTFVNPDQFSHLKNMWNQVTPLMGNSTFVGANPVQQQAWQMGMNAAGGANNMLNQMQGANSFFMNPSSMFQNPYAKQATDYAAQGLQDQFKNTVNDLRGQGIAAGQWTTGEGKGTFNKGVTQAMNPFGRAMEGLYSNMGNNMYNTGMNNFNQAIDRIPTMANLGFSGSNYLQGIGNQMRGIGQEAAMEPWQRLQLAQGLFGAPIMQSQSQSSGTASGYNNPGMLGGATDAASTGAGLWMLGGM